MEKQKIYYITHIVPDKLPTKGLLKLFFYTTTEEGDRNGIYHFGKGSKSFTREEIIRKVNEGNLIPLQQMKFLDSNKGLWLSAEGKVFYADLKNPSIDKVHLCSPIQLSKSYQEYKKAVKSLKHAPQIEWETETAI
jgi:hypothetical protein